MNTIVLQLEIGSIELFSTVRYLHIGHFLLHTSLFSIGSTRGIV
jgi:hypothetical protein